MIPKKMWLAYGGLLLRRTKRRSKAAIHARNRELLERCLKRGEWWIK